MGQNRRHCSDGRPGLRRARVGCQPVDVRQLLHHRFALVLGRVHLRGVLEGDHRLLQPDGRAVAVGHGELTSLIGGRRADIIAGAYFPGYLDSKELSNSEGYHQGQLSIIRRSSSEEAVIGKIAELNPSEFSGLEGYNFVIFHSLDEMVQAYNEGMVGGFIADSGRMSSALYRINTSLREESEIVNLGELDYGFAVSAEEKELLDQLNSYLAEMSRSGRIDELVSEHFRW